ncbi:hypothetical protein Tco_0653320 [Tanacetum coccineum]|uniref:Uncharacterized protein n=1 Tax=Tanacetum coccineum TaxID=301880 RepID=A0ABQ4X016_9ASTR
MRMVGCSSESSRAMNQNQKSLCSGTMVTAGNGGDGIEWECNAGQGKPVKCPNVMEMDILQGNGNTLNQMWIINKFKTCSDEDTSSRQMYVAFDSDGDDSNGMLSHYSWPICLAWSAITRGQHAPMSI